MTARSTNPMTPTCSPAQWAAVGSSVSGSRRCCRQRERPAAVAGRPARTTPTHRTNSGKRGAHAVSSLASATSEDVIDHAADLSTRGVKYPEWDVNRKSYRADWCTVVEIELGDKGIGESGDRRRHRLCDARWPGSGWVCTAGTGRRRATTSTSTPRSKRTSKRWPGRCPTRRYISTACGDDGTCRCFCCWTSRVRRPRPARWGEPCIEQQRAAVANLTVALHDLGDRVALYAYYSQGRSRGEHGARQAI